jgi:hypothetical protein
LIVHIEAPEVASLTNRITQLEEVVSRISDRVAGRVLRFFSRKDVVPDDFSGWKLSLGKYIGLFVGSHYLYRIDSAQLVHISRFLSKKNPSYERD